MFIKINIPLVVFLLERILMNHYLLLVVDDIQQTQNAQFKNAIENDRVFSIKTGVYLVNTDETTSEYLMRIRGFVGESSVFICPVSATELNQAHLPSRLKNWYQSRPSAA